MDKEADLYTAEMQLKSWVEGRPIHNEHKDECCPDFSCCRGVEFMVDEDVRKRFSEAYLNEDQETVDQMLMMFLGAAMADTKAKVYIAGDGSITGPKH